MWQDGWQRGQMVSAGVHGMAAGTSDKAPAPCRTEEPGARGRLRKAARTHCIQEHQEL